MAKNVAGNAPAVIVGGDIERATSAWLDSLTLEPHQRPLAEMARTIARRMDEGSAFSAAMVEAYASIVERLTPPDARRHRSQQNSAAIRGASKPTGRHAKVGDETDAE